MLPGIYVAAGPGSLPAWFLSALCPALRRGMKVFWLDASNSFDAYGLSCAARALGWDPKSVLRSVRLARPFNLFQLETMVREKLPRQWRGEPIVISDPFPLFFDEDVPASQARKVFSRVLSGMKALHAVWLVLAVERKAPEDRGALVQDLMSIASCMAITLKDRTSVT